MATKTEILAEDRAKRAEAKATRKIENDEYVAMLQRMIRALEARAIDDPAILSQVLLLAQQLNQITNVVVSQSAATYRLNPLKAPSMMEIGRMLGITKQSASERRKVGDRILTDRLLADAGVGVSPEERTPAGRERAARRRAAEHAAAAMPTYYEAKHSASV